jgi:alkanesulfonate monooxygenase SsuD/methylene tetrahydromethanopterin reductase-like flavin-dependent oxidoreductase (luciferase family)
MQPAPPPIPVYVGGLSDAALRRAARNDGWIGDLIKTDRAIEAVGRLRELRAENGLSLDDFTSLTPLTDAFTTADYRRAADAGITGIITMPWMFYAAPDATLADKIDGMQRFRKDPARRLDVELVSPCALPYSRHAFYGGFQQRRTAGLWRIRQL